MEMSEKENNEQIPKFAQVSTDVAFQESKKKKLLKSSENKSEYNYGYFEAKSSCSPLQKFLSLQGAWRQMRKRVASRNAFHGALACDLSKRPWCCNSFCQSFQERTKTEKLGYLAHNVEKPVREVREKREGRERKTTERQPGKVEEQAGEAPVTS